VATCDYYTPKEILPFKSRKLHQFHHLDPAMPSELDKSRLAVADEVKFDMFATIPELCDHAKQYKAISRNFACE
jgi:hypothetical protein